ncbi:MAG: hypothetical protein LBD79_02455 [Treponema sp.]|jgi:hypothetical protein|nr:hypothetical protein [Treponema sp.]
MTVPILVRSSSHRRIPLIILLILIAGSPAAADEPTMPFTIGVNVGSCFVTPALTLSPSISIPLVAVVYLDAGCDFGFLSNAADYINKLSYNSYYPYGRISVFIPFDYYDDESGFHLGLGYGHMIAHYKFGGYDKYTTASAFDMAMGCLIISAIDISYSLRISAKGVSHKLSIGFVYKFGS